MQFADKDQVASSFEEAEKGSRQHPPSILGTKGRIHSSRDSFPKSMSQLTKSIARISPRSPPLKVISFQSILNVGRRAWRRVPFDRVNLDDDNVGASGLIEQWEQGGVAMNPPSQ